MAFDMDQMEKLLKQIGKSGDSSKSAKDLAKLQGKLQSQLAEQQAQYAQQLAAQNAAAQLAAQREAQAADAAAQRDLFQMKVPFEQANLTGTYNGQQTLASRQQQNQVDQFNRQFGEDTRQFNTTFGEDQRQFNQSFGEDQRQFNQTFGEQQRQFDTENELNKQRLALENEIQHRQQALDELTQQQNNAIQQGQLDLSRQIETEKIRLQGEQQAAQIKLETAQTSGFMDNGQLTEAARAARAREGMDQVGMMGVDANGNLTDASQQWRTSAGLDAARVNAQLGQQSSDYFEAAAYNRDPNVQNALAFLNASQQGSSMGFRSAATGVPGTQSIAGLSGGPAVNPALMPNPQQNVAGPQGAQGPSASVAAAQAAVQGQPAAFTSQMNEKITPSGRIPGDGMNPAAMTAAYQAAQQGIPAQPQVAGSMAAYNQNVSMRPDTAQQRLSAIQQQLIMPGAHKLAPGSMESWSPTEKGLVQSGLKASGINPADFEQQYQRSKLQTGLSATAI